MASSISRDRMERVHRQTSRLGQELQKDLQNGEEKNRDRDSKRSNKCYKGRVHLVKTTFVDSALTSTPKYNDIRMPHNSTSVVKQVNK